MGGCDDEGDAIWFRSWLCRMRSHEDKVPPLLLAARISSHLLGGLWILGWLICRAEAQYLGQIAYSQGKSSKEDQSVRSVEAPAAGMMRVMHL